MFIALAASVLSVCGGIEVDKGLSKQVDECPTIQEKIAYLASVISTNATSTTAGNLRTSSAITLLGRVGGTNVIQTLVTNLTFIDARYHGSPASDALAKIGDPAVPELLNVVKESGDEEQIRWAAMTVGFIKRHMWKDFMDEQKHKLPEEAWKKLKRYAIIVQ